MTGLYSKPWNDPEVRWVCEEHPTKDLEHRVWIIWPFWSKECGGAGIPDPKDERNYEKGYIAKSLT